MTTRESLFFMVGIELMVLPAVFVTVIGPMAVLALLAVGLLSAMYGLYLLTYK